MKRVALSLLGVWALTSAAALPASAAACPEDKKPTKPSLHCPEDKKPTHPSLACPEDKKPTKPSLA